MAVSDRDIDRLVLRAVLYSLSDKVEKLNFSLLNRGVWAAAARLLVALQLTSQ